MAIVNNEDGFTQLTKLNVTDKLLVQGNQVFGVSETLTDGEVPVFQSVDSSLVSSGATVDAITGEWTFDKSINIPSGSLKVGEAVTISEGIQNIVISDQINAVNAFSVNSVFDSTGASVPIYLGLGTEFAINSQIDDSTLITTNPLNFSVATTVLDPDKRVLFRLTNRSQSGMTNYRFKMTDSATGKVIKYVPSKASFEADGGSQQLIDNPGLTYVAGDNVIDFVSTADDTPGVSNIGVSPLIFEQGQTVNVQSKADSMDLLGTVSEIPYLVIVVEDGPEIELAIAAAAYTDGSVPFSDALGDLTEDNANFRYDADLDRLFLSNLTVTGDALVEGTVTIIDTENLSVTNSFIDMNAGYAVPAPKVGGLAVNYLPTLTTDTVTAGAFTPGVNAVSNPTVVTDTATVFTAGDILQVSESSGGENNGYFEALTHAANLLTVRGIGLTPTIEAFSRNNFIANASDSAVITKINVSALRSGVDGDWEEGKGSVTPIVYNKISDDTPGGSDTEFQYNNAGVFAGTPGITYSGSSLDLSDNIPLIFGLGNDLTIVHNETDTLFVSNTGDMEFYNTDATGLIFFTLGTDTAATSFQVRDNSANPILDVLGDGYVGIGNSDPHAPLQFENALSSRKIVLWEVVNNDHQFFGLGLDNQVFRYQVASTVSDHVFYAGTSSTTSDELMRITGDGFVGIGTSTPHAPLQFANSGDNRKIVINEAVDNDHEYYGFGTNPSALRYQVPSTSSRHVFYAGTSATTSDELFRINGDGLVGIGGAVPHAQFQLSNIISNRSIVLWEQTNNDHQFFGLGINSGVFRHQVPSTTIDYVFYAGTSDTTSDELMRILGDGNVTIGTVGSGGRFAFFKSTDDSSSNIYSGSATGSASTVFHNSASAIAADIIFDEIANNFSISTEAAVDLIIATGSGANIGVNKPIPVSTLHISEGTTTSDATTGTTFEQIGLGSAVTHYVRTNTGTVFSSGIDADDIYKISNDYDLAVNTDISINTEGNIDFKNSIATPYGGFGRLQNLLLWSEDTTNAVWQDFPAILTATGDTTLAPDGTLSADTWDFTATIGLAKRPLVTLAQGNTYTVSFYARALTTARILRFDLGDALSGDINVLVTDDLQRYSLQLVAGVQNWLDITNVVASIGTVYVWGFQLSEGVERLPYTRTEAVQVHSTGPESGLAVNHSAIFSTIAAPNYSEGTLFYDDGDKALSYYNDDSNVTIGIGRDLLVRVQNAQGLTISSGEAVYINGSSGGLPTVRLAQSNAESTSQFAGIVTETLVLNGEVGYVSTFGLIEFLNTSAWSAGDELYLSSTVAGALTNVPPTYPNNIVSVAHVVISDLITGSIQVHTPERIVSDGTKRIAFAATTTTGALGQSGIYAYTAIVAPVTLTLSASTLALGSLTQAMEFLIIDEAGGCGTNTLTLDTAGAEKINGLDTYLLDTDHASVTLYTNGANYFII